MRDAPIARWIRGSRISSIPNRIQAVALSHSARLPGVIQPLPRRGEDQIATPPHRRKEGLEAIVIALQNRIELVVVTLRTTDPETEKGLGGDVGEFVDDQLPMRAHVALIVLIDPVAQKGGANQHLRISGIDLVARQLFAHEAIVGLVLVEGPDHPITIGPSIGPEGVLPVPVALREPDHVQPVLSPTLAHSAGSPTGGR